MREFLGHLITSGIDYVGLVIFLLGCFFMLIVAFQKSIGWGIAMLLFGGILWPVFVLLNWKATSYWFFFALAGSLIMYIF